MSLRTAHIVLIGAGIALAFLIAVKHLWLVSTGAAGHEPMAAFGSVAAVGLSIYLARFVRRGGKSASA